jgi:leader peptidase (prepilin peptidase)/N-methyltransferase
MPLFEITYIGVFTVVLAFIFGTVLASFITCTAGRVLAGEDWTRGFSHCDTCGHKLEAPDLFPVISYIALGGKCRYCGSKVPIRCLISEVLLGVAFVAVVFAHGYIDAVMVRNLLLAMLMMGISFCDIDGHIIHGGFTTAILVIWIGALPFIPELNKYTADGVCAAALIAGGMMLVSYAKTSAGKPGIDSGLIKLVAVYLLYTGLWEGLAALLMTVVIGLIAKSSKKDGKVAIVPILSICVIICLCVGDRLFGSALTGYVSAIAGFMRTFSI